MRKITIALALLAAVALPAGAQAKEVTSVAICGPDSCRTITDRSLLTQFEEAAGSTDLYVGPVAPAPYLVVRVKVDAGSDSFTWQSFYVPSGRVMRGTNEQNRASWRSMPRTEWTLMDSFAAGVTPFAVPTVTRATVGARTAVNPASYLGLYRLKRTRGAYPKRDYWLRIRLFSDTASPWTDGTNLLRYNPRERLLERDGDYVRLSKPTARALAKASALRFRPAAGVFTRIGIF
jgi:hypothetical protein